MSCTVHIQPVHRSGTPACVQVDTVTNDKQHHQAAVASTFEVFGSLTYEYRSANGGTLVSMACLDACSIQVLRSICQQCTTSSIC